MRRIALILPSLLLTVVPVLAQVESAKLRVRAALVDKDLNVKPVPKLVLMLQSLEESPRTAEISVTTGFDGIADVEVPVGRYHLSTPQPVEFQGQSYNWDLEVTITEPAKTLELSNDNAKKTKAASTGGAGGTDELMAQFKRLQGSVLYVWSESGQGTGFVVDAGGLVLTNQHVVGKSDYLAVQFDSLRKIPAILLAADPEKDIAVLWVNLSAFPEAVVAPLAMRKGTEAEVAEGERVFTIGNPLSQTRILTSGIVSRVEPRTLVSDININPGNSGGPLFNSRGLVVGVTTFRRSVRGGPGLTGVIRIEQAEPLLAEARQRMVGKSAPIPVLLPVAPKDAFPVEALQASLQQPKFDIRPYIFDEGDYKVTIFTPILSYYLAHLRAVEALREKEKRMKAGKEEEASALAESLKNVPAYATQYRPVIIVQAVPRLESSAWTAKMRFKTDFHRMRLLCGGREVSPIHPFRFTRMLTVQGRSLNASDTTYEGVYHYTADAISPGCGQVVLEIYSEEQPDRPARKYLDGKTVERISSDFEPYRKAHLADVGAH